jgi:hypothetical protein
MSLVGHVHFADTDACVSRSLIECLADNLFRASLLYDWAEEGVIVEILP